MATVANTIVDDSEQIARIVSKEWVIDGVLMPQAFELAPKETYLSVNRTCIDSYDEDVSRFVKSHLQYLSEDGLSYSRALLSVADVRAIKVSYEDTVLQIGVEVEPRATHTPSHAGIFVRSEGMNIVLGKQLPGHTVPEGISAEMVLQQVQWELYYLANLQKCQLKP